MSSATMTLIGLYKYNHTLFDYLTFPVGIDKGVVIDTILMRGGEYEVIYSNLDLLKQMFKAWSKSNEFVFEQWLRAYNDLAEVAPLENYDRIENWSDSASNSERDSLSTSESTNNSNSASNSNSYTESMSMSEIDNVYAYDNSQGTPKNAHSAAQNNNNAVTSFTQYGNVGNSNLISNNNKDRLDYSIHGGRIHGNIGVTTSTQMWRDWVLALEEYGNIYERIALMFLQSFVIPIL